MSHIYLFAKRLRWGDNDELEELCVERSTDAHGQSFSGAKGGGLSPSMMISLGARGAKPPPCMETFQYLNTLAFAFNHSASIIESISFHSLFSPPMNWIILCLAPHELKPNSAHADAT